MDKKFGISNKQTNILTGYINIQKKKKNHRETRKENFPGRIKAGNTRYTLVYTHRLSNVIIIIGAEIKWTRFCVVIVFYFFTVVGKFKLLSLFLLFLQTQSMSTILFWIVEKIEKNHDHHNHHQQQTNFVVVLMAVMMLNVRK